MKDLFKKISAVLLAFVVVFSTMSFTFSEHYCGEHIVDIGFFSKAESCGMEMQLPNSKGDCNINKDNCCSDVLKQFEGQNELKTDTTSFSLEKQYFIASFINTYINLFKSLEESNIPFKDYSPPFIVKDIQILDEVYLI